MSIFSDAWDAGAGIVGAGAGFVGDRFNDAKGMAGFGGNDPAYNPDPNAFKQGGNSDFYRDQIKQGFIDAQNRAAPTSEAAQVGPAANVRGELGTDYGTATGYQKGNLGALWDQAQGKGISVADQQMRAGLGQAMAAQKSMAAGATGGNRALAQRGASMNMAGAQQNIAAQSGIARAQEALSARGMIGQQAGQLAGQEIGLAGQQAGLNQQTNLTQAGFNQQTNLANQSAQLSQTGLNDAMQQGYMGYGLTQEQQAMAAAIEQEKIKAGLAQNAENANTQRQAATIGAGATIVGTAAKAGGM